MIRLLLVGGGDGSTYRRPHVAHCQTEEKEGSAFCEGGGGGGGEGAQVWTFDEGLLRCVGGGVDFRLAMAVRKGWRHMVHCSLRFLVKGGLKAGASLWRKLFGDWK